MRGGTSGLNHCMDKGVICCDKEDGIGAGLGRKSRILCWRLTCEMPCGTIEQASGKLGLELSGEEKDIDSSQGIQRELEL